jgi:hypothetical protein
LSRSVRQGGAFGSAFVASTVPIRHRLSQIVIYNLVIPVSAGPSSGPSLQTVAQLSVQVADAGSNPAGSILPVVVEKFIEERRQR